MTKDGEQVERFLASLQTDLVRAMQEAREARFANAEYAREVGRLGIKTGPFSLEEN